MRDILRGGDRCEDYEGSHEKTIHGMPELHYRHCKSKDEFNGLSRP